MLVVELTIPPFPMLTTVGHTLWQAGVIHAQRQFDVYDLIICTKGTLYMEEGGQKYNLKQGMMLLLEPGKKHRGYHPTDSETEVYWIHFHYINNSQLKQKSKAPQPLLPTTDQDTISHPATVEIPKFSNVDVRILVPILEEMIQLHSVLTPLGCMNYSFSLDNYLCKSRMG
ncbi:AraC family ligand binding domain-containing protein [Paenibacillus yanchengensis]|uniref:AraC family ligand binding domain-containing protein n=1 Tax=Paenibacillus yanchengensis TaxID=2035833 RepID=A0ABW4YHC0_9BACL